jgi:hypothetical protein
MAKPTFDLGEVEAERDDLVEAKGGNDVARNVMAEVLKGAAKCFEDEGIPEEVLLRLQALWTTKLDIVRREKPNADLSGDLVTGFDENLEVVEPSSSSSSFGKLTGARPKTASAIKAGKIKAAKTKKEEARRKKQHKKSKKVKMVSQVDGPTGDDSSDDDDDLDNVDDDDDEDNDDDDDDDDSDDKEEEENEDGGADEEPLGTEDDISDEDPADLFDTENVVVCQYDRITRARNRWKFHLKDGIMNLNGRDYVFQKANGDAEW